jgi:hypothetical protein
MRGSDYQTIAFKYRQRNIKGLAGSLRSVVGAWHPVANGVEKATDARATAN